LVLPAVTELLRKNPGIDFSYHIRETHELQRLLQSGEVDMIFLDQEVRREGLVQEFLGFEEFVFITSKKSKDSEIHLNHDENDLMSYKYYDAIGESKEGIKRRYLDEIYSVMDGVAAGLGVSILPYQRILSYPPLRRGLSLRCIFVIRNALITLNFLGPLRMLFWSILIKISIKTDYSCPA
jgi:DNA-binding transcriptional LysR family regulator